jgi:hypothetical protein
MRPQFFADLQRPDFKISSNFFSSPSICIKPGPSVWKLLHVIHRSSRSSTVSLEFMLQDNSIQKHYVQLPLWIKPSHMMQVNYLIDMISCSQDQGKKYKNYYPVSIAKWAFSVGRCESSQLHLFYRQKLARIGKLIVHSSKSIIKSQGPVSQIVLKLAIY